MRNIDIIKATILIDKKIWQLFKELCKTNETDASKEIRKFIKEYIVNYLVKNELSIEDAYQIYSSLSNLNNFEFYLIEEDEESHFEARIKHIGKYVDFGQINFFYLINKKNIKNVLNSFVKKFEDKDFIKEYDLEDRIDKDEINEIINAIKNIDINNIDYDKVFNLIENIYEKCYQVVDDVLDEKAEKILNDMLENNDTFHCLYEYEYLKKLIKKEENKEILVIVPDDYLNKLSDIDIDYEDSVIYYILYSQDGIYQYEHELFYNANSNYNLNNYKIKVKYKV